MQRARPRRRAACAVISLSMWAVILAAPAPGQSTQNQSSDTGKAGVELVAATRVPQSRVRPGGILILKATVRNSGTERGEGVVVVTIDGEPDKQSARHISLGPGETEHTEIHTLLPKSIAGKNMIDITTRLYVDDGGREVLQDKGGRPAEYTLALAVAGTETAAALIMDPEPTRKPFWYWPPARPHTSYEFAVATRIDAGNSRQTTNFDRSILPVNQADWEMLDVVMIAEEHAFDDAAFTESLKRFVTRGGRAWIMLDRIPTSVIRPLLGASQMCETVDEVALTDFVVEQIGSAAELSEADLTVSSAEPYKFKRVLQSGGRVTHWVNGWPAAIWLKIGYGQILLTTLDPAAWIGPRENPSTDVRFYSPYSSRLWANHLALSVNTYGFEQPLVEDVEYPLQQIGNPVVPKPWVMTTLIGFCLILGAVGTWRVVSGEPSFVGFAAPILAILASAGLLFASTLIRREIPESISSLQIIQVAEDGQSAIAREQSAVYLVNSTDMKLECEQDGVAFVDENVTAGTRRFELVDFQKWQLSNQAWPAGSWRYNTAFSFSTQDLVVDAKLTRNGVELYLPDNLPSPLEDPILSFAVGSPMLCSSTGESLLVDGSSNAGNGRWISGTLIDNEQQRRLEVYDQFFKDGERKHFLNRVLYGWTDHWAEGPRWSRDLPRNGSALVSLPVRLARPPAGEPILIPKGMIELRRDSSQLGSSFAYNDLTGQWVDELTMGVSARLQLLLPEEVLPFAAESIEIELDMKAPHRDVVLLCESENGPIELMQLSNPSIPHKITSTDPNLLQEARNGVLNLVLQVSDRTDVQDQLNTGNIVAWNVDSLNASFQGRVAKASASSGP